MVWLAFVLAAPLPVPPPVWAQNPPSERAGANPDSADILGRARTLQARFERTRIRELPLSNGGRPGKCDEIIGRLCIWDGSSDGWTPKPEPAAVVDARDELLERLDSLASLIPGDHWIFGQRIRYLSEAGRLPEAEALASRCGLPQPWRCDAYRGYVLHESEEIPAATGAFEDALDRMPAELRQKWTAVDPILGRELRSWMREQVDSAQAVSQIWMLADPLFLAPGNDRWTGHLSRWTYAMSGERARSPHQLTWGSDLTEAVVRYGWAISWEKPWPTPGQSGSGSAIGHDPPAAVRVLPPRHVLEDPALAGTEWELTRRQAASVYLPPYLDSLGGLEGQVGRFWRGSSVVLMSAFDVPSPDESTPSGAGAGLFLARDGQIALDVRVGGRVGQPVRLAGRIPAASVGVLSLEVWLPELRRAYRLRTALDLHERPPDVLALSDLVLVGDGRAETLEDLELLLRPSTKVGPHEALAVAFETYGLGFREEEVGFRTWVEKEDEGLVSRALGWLRLKDPDDRLSLAWSEPGPDGPEPLFRMVQLGVPALEPGAYHLVLEVSAPGRSAVQGRRRFTVVEPPTAAGR